MNGRHCLVFFLSVFLSQISNAGYTEQKSETVAQVSSAKFSISFEDPVLLRGTEMAEYIFEKMGLELPPIVIMPNQDGAWTQGGVIYVGDQLAFQLPDYGIAQIIMHEAGHIFEGHTGILGEAIDALYKEGLITDEQYQNFQHNDEYNADAWAALGAWILDPNPSWPAISQWLAEQNEPPSDTHPGGMERAQLIADTVADLYSIEASGFFEQSGLDLGGYDSDNGHVPGSDNSDDGDESDDGDGGGGDDGGGE